MRQMREGNERFHAQRSFSPTPLILSHPEIYIPLANFIIKYRVATWHYTQTSREDVMEALRKDYLPPILAHAKKCELSEQKIQLLSRAVLNLVNRITQNSGHNTVWVTAYLVKLYQKNSLNFFTHQSPFTALHRVRNDVYNSSQRIKNQQLPESQRLLGHQVLKRELKGIKQNDHTFNQNREKFLGYMPPSCQIKQNIHGWAQIILMFIFTLGFLLLIGKANGLFLVLPVISPIFYIPLEIISPIKILFRDPFTFSNMADREKTGLLTKIARSLCIKKEAKHVTAVRAAPRRALHTTEVDDRPPSYPPVDNFRPKKSRAKKPAPTEEAMDEKEGIDTLLASAQLAPSIILVWDTIQWGVITAEIGGTLEDLYPLWSGHYPHYEFCYVYFPEQELQQHEDQGMLNECKEVLATGHVVPPVGHAGIVRESKDTLKIKMLSSGKGTQATGKPSEWRYSLFCLTHPQDLNAPPPRVGSHQYQLYAPNHLSKTH